MSSGFTSVLLRWLKVPHEPQPPHGHPASLRVFRAGRNYFRLRLARWGIGQLLALLGIGLSIAIFVSASAEIAVRREAGGNVRLNPDRFAKSLKEAARREETMSTGPAPLRRLRAHFAAARQAVIEVLLRAPPGVIVLLQVLKVVGILAYLIQLPVTFLVVRLDYELRWYMVTDRSLRLRHGVWKISEATMSFANIQQVIVSQGPLQRLLGLADVRVQSAGGDSGGGNDVHSQMHGREDMHLGLFHSVTNASEIRDLILERLRRFREAGLGDPDETAMPVAPTEPPAFANSSSELSAATQELVAAARALRDLR